MARRVKFQDGKLVDDGPVAPRKPAKKGPKKFIIEVHHKRIGKKGADLPNWVFEHPDLTIKTPPQMRGEATRAMVERARRKMDEGLSAKEAAADTEKFILERFNMSKLLKGKDLYGLIYRRLRKKRGGP